MVVPHRSMLGALLYLSMNTRPDLYIIRCGSAISVWFEAHRGNMHVNGILTTALQRYPAMQVAVVRFRIQRTTEYL